MSKLMNLVVEGKLIEAARIVKDEKSIDDLSNVVSFLKGMSNEDLNKMKAEIESQVEQNKAKMEEIKAEGVQLNKAQVQKTIIEYTEKVAENEAEIAKLAEQVIPAVAEVKEQNERPCECGGKMVKRTSYKGAFLGCNQFPKCKKTSNNIKELSIEMKELKFKYESLSLDNSKMKSYLKFNTVDKIKNPLYTKEMKDEVNELTLKNKDLNYSLQILEQIKKGEKTSFENNLAILIKNEKVRPYIEAFDSKPYMKDDMLIENFEKLQYIESQVKEKLSKCENFKCLNFCDVSAGGIQLRGMHKQVTGYSYGAQITLKYDFSNIEEAIEQFVNAWIEADTPEKVASYQSFLADGEKYGWD